MFLLRLRVAVLKIEIWLWYCALCVFSVFSCDYAGSRCCSYCWIVILFSDTVLVWAQLRACWGCFSLNRSSNDLIAVAIASFLRIVFIVRVADWIWMVASVWIVIRLKHVFFIDFDIVFLFQCAWLLVAVAWWCLMCICCCVAAFLFGCWLELLEALRVKSFSSSCVERCSRHRGKLRLVCRHLADGHRCDSKAHVHALKKSRQRHQAQAKLGLNMGARQPLARSIAYQELAEGWRSRVLVEECFAEGTLLINDHLHTGIQQWVVGWHAQALRCVCVCMCVCDSYPLSSSKLRFVGVLLWRSEEHLWWGFIAFSAN